jgi:hypothetical protein
MPVGILQAGIHSWLTPSFNGEQLGGTTTLAHVNKYMCMQTEVDRANTFTRAEYVHEYA